MYPKIPVSDLDQTALVEQMIAQLDELNWTPVGSNKDVRVFVTSEIDCPYDGFLTVTEHPASLTELTAFLGRNICGAMAEMNHLYLDGEVIRTIIDNGPLDYYAVVRTMFKMPFPMSNREFPHSLFVTMRRPEEAFVVYHSVSDSELPPVPKGFVRCPTYLSGQRITDLGNGSTRVEHMMVYGLAGAIGPWVQNKVFRKGHIKAYLSEWQQLVNRFRR